MIGTEARGAEASWVTAKPATATQDGRHPATRWRTRVLRLGGLNGRVRRLKLERTGNERR